MMSCWAGVISHERLAGNDPHSIAWQQPVNSAMSPKSCFLRHRRLHSRPVSLRVRSYSLGACGFLDRSLKFGGAVLRGMFSMHPLPGVAAYPGELSIIHIPKIGDHVL
jgi:hypothetical protein